MGEDKYLEKLEELRAGEDFSKSKKIEKNKKRFEKFKRGYSNEEIFGYEGFNKYVSRGTEQKYLNLALLEAMKKGNVNLGLDAIEEIKMSHITSPSKKIFNRKSVKNRLIQAYENSKKRTDLNAKDREMSYKRLNKFLKANPSEEEVKNPLERLLKPFSFLFILASLFFLSSNITGNVISTLTTRTSNFIGIPLFFVGLGFLVFSLRR